MFQRPVLNVENRIKVEIGVRNMYKKKNRTNSLEIRQKVEALNQLSL